MASLSLSTRAKKEQKRKRWAESGTSCSADYIKAVEAAAENQEAAPSLRILAAELRAFTRLQNYFAEKERIKPILKLLRDVEESSLPLAGAPGPMDPAARSALAKAYRLVFEVTFFENSKPMHKAFFSHAQKLPPSHWEVCAEQLTDLFRTFSGLSKGASSRDAPYRIILSDTAASVLDLDALPVVLRPVAAEVALSLAAQTTALLELSLAGSSAPMARVEEVADAVGSLYHLVRMLGQAEGAGADGPAGRAVVAATRVALLGLRAPLLQRESAVASGILLWSCLNVPEIDPLVQLVNAARLLGLPARSQLSPLQPSYASGIPTVTEARSLQAGLDLAAELSSLSPFGRLCAVRGALIAVPPASLTAPLGPAALNGQTESFVTLYALPAILHSLSDTTDAHIKYHGVSALSTLLERAALVAAAEPPMPLVALPRPDRDRVLETLWSHWEDPVDQTALRAQQAFGSLLDLIEREASAAGPAAAIGQLARDLLAMSDDRKGKFTALAAIAKRIGAVSLSEIAGGFGAVFRPCFAAMSDQVLCCSVVTFLTAVLESLATELPDIRQWVAAWSSPLIAALCGPDDDIRNHVGVYGAGTVLKVRPIALPHILGLLVASPYEENIRAAAAVSVLRAAKREGLFESIAQVMGPDRLVPDSLYLAALSSSSDQTRLDAFEVIAAHPRPTSLPPPVELKVASAALRLGMRASFVGTRNKFCAHVKRLLTRLKTGTHSASMRLIREEKDRQGVPQHSQPVKPPAGTAAGLPPPEDDGDTVTALGRVEKFLQELTSMCLDSLYPSATNERAIIASDILCAMLELWPPELLQPSPHIDPYPVSVLLTRETSAQLLGSVGSAWSTVREAAMRCTALVPAPLPGYTLAQDLQPLLDAANELSASPRPRESDAAARLVRLLFRKYVRALGWNLAVQPTITLEAPASTSSAPSLVQAQLSCLSSLCDRLEADVARGKADLFTACRTSLCHNTLIILRQIVADVDWPAILKDEDGSRATAAALMERLFVMLRSAIDMSVWALSNPKELNVMANEVSPIGLGSNGDAPAECDAMEDVEEDAGGTDAGDDAGDAEDGAADPDMYNLNPRAQVMVTASWTTAKEVAYVSAELCRRVPRAAEGWQVLTGAQLHSMASRLLLALHTMKHNGAVDKCHTGLSSICARLLSAPDPQVSAVPSALAQEVMTHMESTEQLRDDIVRRSAGIPFALRAILRAEPSSASRTMLNRVMTRIIEIADDSTRLTYDLAWPRVHSFNVLRVVLEDAELGVDASAFTADGLRAAVGALGAPQWEVRNAASLAFTALLVRITGYKNPSNDMSRERARKSITAESFFHRYPGLHSFLLDALTRAAAGLRAEAGAGVPPSLFPILTLLARLKPSPTGRSSVERDTLSPGAFLPVLSDCATARQYGVRAMAARAFAPLVAVDDLDGAARTILKSMPLSDALPTGTALNVIHGRLLQLRSLLELNCRMPTAEPAKLLRAVVPGLLGRVTWLSQPNKPGLIRTEASRVALGILQAAEGAWEHLPEPTRALARQFAEEAEALSRASILGGPAPAARLAVPLTTEAAPYSVRRDASTGAETAIATVSSAIDGIDPANSVHSSDAACLLFSTSLATALGRAPSAAAVVEVLAGSSYEAREAALRALMRFPTADGSTACPPSTSSSSSCPPLKPEVGPAVLKHLAVEAVPDCLGAALSVLVNFGLEASTRNYDVIRSAIQLSGLSGDPKVVAAGLRSLATSLNGLGPSSLGHLLQLVSEMEASSDQAAVEDLRTAAAYAVGSSGILETPLASPSAGTDGLIALALRSWDVAVTLLEDDDLWVRDVARRTVTAVLTKQGEAIMGGRSAEWILRRAVDRLARGCAAALSSGGGAPAASKAARAIVAQRLIPGRVLSVAEAHLKADAASGKKIFDRELNNYHEETLLVARAFAVGLLEGAAKPDAILTALRNGASDASAPDLFSTASSLGPQLVAAQVSSVSGGNGDVFLALAHCVLASCLEARLSGLGTPWTAWVAESGVMEEKGTFLARLLCRLCSLGQSDSAPGTPGLANGSEFRHVFDL